MATMHPKLSGNDPSSVLLADDHPLFRKGIRSLLETQPDITVLSDATNASEACELAINLLPDVVLMDLHMPGGGVEATRTISRTAPSVRVLVVTMFQDDSSVFTALRAGARGYILKDADENELLRAIRAVARGEAIFSPGVASRVLEYFARPRPLLPAKLFPELTPREREILALIAQGQGNLAIAQALGLSLKTVANYASNIFSKLQVADRAEAVAKARSVGIGEQR